MSVKSWQELKFNPGILRENVSDNRRIVIWVPREKDQSGQLWERIGSENNSAFSPVAGLHAGRAVTLLVRQSKQSLFGGIMGRLRKENDATWVLPNGVSAVQSGERRTDALIVWTNDEKTPLDESRLRQHWPQANRFERLGENSFLVGGIEEEKTEAALAPETPLAAAQRLLAAARASANHQGIASALADVGAVYLHEGKSTEAVQALAESLALWRQLGETARAGDVLGNLGQVTLSAGHPQRALEIFAEELGIARQSGDRFAEKMSLERIGLAQGKLNESQKAIDSFTQALAIAREVGHRKHQADLLWYLAIQHAELDQRDLALENAEAALDLMRKMGSPQAEWYQRTLENYRLGQSWEIDWNKDSAAQGDPANMLGGTTAGGLWAPNKQDAGKQAQGPGLLRMAVSAARSMAKFAGSGFKVTPSATIAQRLKTCNTCEHHTGVRCRLCGCFTSAKTRMAHEECPIGKW
jgi:tetratricopeptide (TPR) repeat protein